MGRNHRAPVQASVPAPAPALALVLVLAPALAGCSVVYGVDDEFQGAGGPTVVTAADVAPRAITEDQIRAAIGFLASSGMRGRDTPSPELDRAAAWIAARFHEAGLEPAGDDGGFLQFWPYAGEGSDGGAAAQVPNVVGVLPGAELERSGEYVILVAHFDHLGVRASEGGDSVYHGADDNASGVAALVAIAGAFQRIRPGPARPLLFLATSGGEKDHMGARWFAANPTVFLTHAVAVLNVHMVSRNDPDSVAVIGRSLSTLGPLLERVAAGEAGVDPGLSIVSAPGPSDDRFAAGDHYPFARLGIPAVSITTLRHDDHHRPTDVPGRVDAEKAARVARLVFLTAAELASGALTPEWTEEGRRAVPVAR